MLPKSAHNTEYQSVYFPTWGGVAYWLAVSGMVAMERNPMITTKVQIPTFDPDRDDYSDYSQMHTITLEQGGGLRIILGEPDDETVPDILIEREKDRWKVFVHPACTDPICFIEIGSSHATITTDTRCGARRGLYVRRQAARCSPGVGGAAAGSCVGLPLSPACPLAAGQPRSGVSAIAEGHQHQRLFLAPARLPALPSSFVTTPLLGRQARAQRGPRQADAARVAAKRLAGYGNLGVPNYSIT